MSNIFDKELEAIEKQRKKINDAAKESKDVKDGIVTEEEELKEPSYVLFNSIMSTIKEIMTKEEVTKSVENIVNTMMSNSGSKSVAAKELIDLMIVIITTSTYQSILCYDDMLKVELTNQFDNITNYFNDVKSTVNAHTGVLSVFKKHLSDIDKKLKVDEVRKQINQ